MGLRGTVMAGAVALAAVLGASGAQATTFVFSFTSALGDASGTLDAAPQGGGAYLVDSVTGDFGSDPITLIAPGGFAGNDNDIYTTSPSLDFSGVSFSAGGTDYNVYYDSGTYVGPGYAICSSCGGGNETLLTSYTLTAVPEPAEWAIMLLGFGTLGSTMRATRRKKAMTVPAA